jgi:hypothetical protein
MSEIVSEGEGDLERERVHEEVSVGEKVDG